MNSPIAAAAAAAAGAAAAAAAVGITRPGSASPYGWLVGLTLAPFVRRSYTHVVRYKYWYLYLLPASHLESRHNIFETKTLQHGMSNKSFW